LPEAIQADIDAGVPPIGIGEGAVVEGAIVDKNARIGKGARIVNVENKTSADGENFVIRDGIVVIPKNVVVPDGSVI